MIPVNEMKMTMNSMYLILSYAYKRIGLKRKKNEEEIINSIDLDIKQY
jgi:hypothetical protein